MTIGKVETISPGIWENAWNFWELSQFVWSQVSISTWEIRDIVTDWSNNTQSCSSNPWFSNKWNVLRWAIWEWWEDQIQRLIPYSRKSVSESLYDLYKSDFNIEVKTSKFWNAWVIKSLQLERLKEIEGKTYYAFVFYKIRWRKKPSDLPNDKSSIRRSLVVEDIFIFPIEYIVFAMNALPKINTIHTPFKKMSHKRVRELFQLATSRILEHWETTYENEGIHAVWDIIDILKK